MSSAAEAKRNFKRTLGTLTMSGLTAFVFSLAMQTLRWKESFVQPV